tara:strand:- start:38 stop:616 length:579 start_codon:yes stop_codon:yes gene_type:complete
MSSFNDGQKVYESTDAGDTWTNISGTNLPNLPVNCIVFQSYTNDDLYIGTDIGVFHKDNSMTEWQSFNTGLPSVSVRELEIQYSSGKLKAATFGRGVWESDLNTAPSAISSFEREMFNVYPIPVEDDLVVTIPFGQKNYTLKIYSLTGQLILSEKLINNTQTINCSSLINGCYIYKIENDKGEFISDKLIVY